MERVLLKRLGRFQFSNQSGFSLVMVSVVMILATIAVTGVYQALKRNTSAVG